MAKRNSRSSANETSAPAAPGAPSAPAQPSKSRRARAGGADTAAAPPPIQRDDTFAARAGANDRPAQDASSSDTRSDSMASEPSEEAIRLRAYQRYLERGAGDGGHFEDWLAAEEELKANQ